MKCEKDENTNDDGLFERLLSQAEAGHGAMKKGDYRFKNRLQYLINVLFEFDEYCSANNQTFWTRENIENAINNEVEMMAEHLK
jgi:hypothetical protein